MAEQRPSRETPGAGRRVWWGETHSLLVVVFVCGAVLMAFEMVGSRILAPTFGSTVFVWGSLIGVFLAALSLGYFVGGKIADKVPSFFLLGMIIAASGLLILVVPLYAPALCQWVDRAFSGRSTNPLISSMLLFFVPSVLLGTVSPFSVRLQAQTVATVGKVAGRLYSLSTLGSIAGTVLATFWMIPSYGTSNITRGLGVTLIAVSLLAILPRLRAQWAAGRLAGTAGTLALLLAAVLLLMVRCPTFIPMEPDQKLIAEADSPYQHIGIVLLKRPGMDEWSLRMVFDKYIESEVIVDNGDPGDLHIREPYTSGAKYTDMLQLPFLFNPGARNVLIVGGGGGVVPTLLRRDYPNLDIDIVEIDPVVVRLAQRYFAFRPNEGRTRTTIMDGRVYIRDCQKKYDIIILDAFTGGRPPFHMLTQEFFRLVRERLSDHGVVHLNIISALDGENGRLYRSVLRTYIDVFGASHVYVFPKWYDPRWGYTAELYRRRYAMNIELIATRSDTNPNPLPSEEIARRADRFVEAGRVHMPSLPIHARNLQPAETERDLSADPILTDDYAPVDTMVTD